MAVAEPRREKEWEQWKGEMEANRRRRWRSWVRYWAGAEVSENEGEREDAWGEWEAEGAEYERQEEGEEERENESETRKRGGEGDVEKEREEKMDGNCEKEVNQEDSGVDEGEDGVKWYEREVGERKREDDENGRITPEVEEIERGYEEQGATSETGGSEEMGDNEKDVKEDSEKWEERKFEVEKTKEKDTRSNGGDEDDLAGMEKDQVLENQDDKGANDALDEEIGREAIEGREESDDDIEEPGEMEAKDGEEMKEGPKKCDCDDEEEEEEEEEEEDEEEDEEEEVHQKQCGQQASRTKNQQSENMKVENEDFNQSDLEKHESNMEEPSKSCYEGDEEEVQSDKMAAETRPLHDGDSGLPEEEEEGGEEEEEESTDDEEDCSAEEGEGSCDEDAVKVYCKEDFVTDFFGTLSDFRHSSVLTDLILSTVDGKSLHVHTAVMAAVSSHIRESLSPSGAENITVGDSREGGIRRRSVSLGPDVDHVGLEAVVEFAYTGLIPCPHMDTIHRIKTAAESLGALRVLDVCTEVEERVKDPQGQKKDAVSAEEEMVRTLQSIKQLWADGAGCDVTLEVLGGSFHVHRVILAVCSHYFRSMFTLGMKESHQSCVRLPFLLASELQFLIDCSYSGALPLSWTYVFEITSTALQLQYEPVLSLCMDFLQQELTPQSCLDVASFAEAYEMAQLQETADDFVLRQFQKVACTLKFLDLPAKQLLRYLNSHSLCVSSELVVFKAVVAWIQAKPKKRLKLAKALMKTIHFPLMTFKEFNEVQSLNMWTDHSMAELYEDVFEDFCANETEPQSQWRIYLPKESLVLIGGDQMSDDLGSRSISKDLWFGNSLRNHTGIRKAMEWRRLAELPESARFRHEVAVLHGKLYVLGGKKYYGTYDTLDSVYRFDPLQNSWESLAKMKEKRCSFSVVVLDGNIYAIGGHCDPTYLDNVERYCPTANSWSFTRPLDQPLGAHVAKVLRGKVFVSGGKSSDYHSLASLFVYHPQSGSTSMATMTRPRAHHCMEALGEHLYVAGGISTDEWMAVVDELACEVYSLASDSWTAVASLPVPHVGAGSAVMEGKFYVLGGYSQEDYSDTALVHRFDPATQRWENMGKMPGPNNDIKASMLCLPQHLRL